ncbi:MAG: neutral zinc metallopeptidase [Hyphomicrobiales bacterium]|nr:neutral zinc metallopeptidase [Hyphomicrobiales bacterium]MBV9430751.1 neutral zinc metallopeptidase [Hyphomicrobiales bacterium]MBV9740226.1 neutral zinc metallopeptidase [Hyphomicrobiales bacterium]
MRLDESEQSENLEDVRGSGGGFGGGLPIPGGRGGLGIGTIIVLGLIGYAFGIDPRILIGGAELLSGGDGQVVQQSQREPQTSGPPSDESGRFVSAVLANTEKVWGDVLPQQTGKSYPPPKLVLYSYETSTACGPGQRTAGPFYCPLDQKVYLDLGFFDDMQRRFGVKMGRFAIAYVVAHEIGHHIQNVLGTLPKVEAAQKRVGDRESNGLQVRVELQADCFAGVWAANADQRFKILEQGDVEDALRAASAVGDDTLQKETQGYVVPDSFTHGTSAQRTRWFSTGLKSGQISACNTFNANPL